MKLRLFNPNTKNMVLKKESLDWSKRKKVFIICSKEEYSILWKYLNQIIDTQSQELIIPYNFMDYEDIDKNMEIEAFTETIKEDASSERYKSILSLKNKNWCERKIKYFETYAEEASLILILNRCGCNTSDCSLEEELKEAEIAFKIFGKKPIGFDISPLIKKDKIK